MYILCCVLWWVTEVTLCQYCFLGVTSCMDSHRSTTWWCCLPTGPTWRTPAECRSTRTSSRRRSRSFTTSTPLAPRSVSTPTHKERRQAWPRLSGLSLRLSSFFLSVPPYQPLSWGGGRRLEPWPLLVHLVRHMTMWSEGCITQLLSHKQRLTRRRPFTSSWRPHFSSKQLLLFFSADCSFSEVCRITGSSNISAFYFILFFALFFL